MENLMEDLSDDDFDINEDVDSGPTEIPRREKERRSLDSSQRRGEANISGISVGDLVDQLLAGGLRQSIEKVAKQQSALVMGEVLDLATPGPSRSGHGDATHLVQGGFDRRPFQIGSEVVDQFDPDEDDSNIERWLKKIDQLGVIYGWSGYMKSTLAQSKLEGAAKRWFQKLDDYDLSWDQWKAKLQAAFPRRRDFAIMVEELVQRQKLPSESMTTYYHAKLALCSRVGIKGENAVSCIIRGLPDSLRANAYAFNCISPEVLYHSFLVGLDGCQDDAFKTTTTASKLALPTRTGRPKQDEIRTGGPRFGEVPKMRRCFNCQRMAYHISRDCPLPKAERCMGCGLASHRLAECPSRQPCEDKKGDTTNQDGRLTQPKRAGAPLSRRGAARGRFHV